jgi:hypothetical protein
MRRTESTGSARPSIGERERRASRPLAVRSATILAGMVLGRPRVAEEHAGAVGDGLVAADRQSQTQFRVGPVARQQHRFVEQVYDSEAMPLRGVRRRGVDQRSVVLHQGMVPGIVERNVAVDVGGQEAGTFKILGLAPAVPIMGRNGDAAQDRVGETLLGQLSVLPVRCGNAQHGFFRLVDDVGIGADGILFVAD